MPLLPGTPSDVKITSRNGNYYVSYMQDGHSVQVEALSRSDAEFKKKEFEKLLADPAKMESDMPLTSALKTALGHMASAQVPFSVVRDIAPTLASQRHPDFKAIKTLPLAMVIEHIKTHGSNWGGKGTGPAACEAYWAESPLLKARTGTKAQAAKDLTYRIAAALAGQERPHGSEVKIPQRKGDLGTYTAFVFWPEQGPDSVEEIDVEAISRKDAIETVKKVLAEGYEPGGKLKELRERWLM